MILAEEWHNTRALKLFIKHINLDNFDTEQL